jgi:4'-phosphopantetheinyl transferase
LGGGDLAGALHGVGRVGDALCRLPECAPRRERGIVRVARVAGPGGDVSSRRRPGGVVARGEVGDGGPMTSGVPRDGTAEPPLWLPRWQAADLARLALDDAACDLWRIDLEQVAVAGGGDPQAADSPLDAAERTRAGRFVFERHRRWYTAARTVLRRVLGGYLGLAPEAVPIGLEELGRPFVVGTAGARAPIDFNLSHSDSLALLAVGRRAPLGTDVELVRSMNDTLALAERNYTGDEIDDVANAAGEARDAAFFTCWTRKEAVLKSTGVGLTVAPRRVYVGARPRTSELQFVSSAGSVPLRLQSLQVREGALGACAMPPEVRIRGTFDWAESLRALGTG